MHKMNSKWMKAVFAYGVIVPCECTNLHRVRATTCSDLCVERDSFCELFANIPYMLREELTEPLVSDIGIIREVARMRMDELCIEEQQNG